MKTIEEFKEFYDANIVAIINGCENDLFYICYEFYKVGYEEAEPKWISVTDILPIYGQQVIALFKNGETYLYNSRCLVYRNNDGDGGDDWWENLLGETWDIDMFTHWMPIPKDPKGEE